MNKYALITLLLGYWCLTIANVAVSAAGDSAPVIARPAIPVSTHDGGDRAVGPGNMEGRLQGAIDDYGVVMDDNLPYSEVNWRLMNDLRGIPLTGDVQYDFLRSTLIHHEATLGMIEVLLEQGSDPDLRALAREIRANKEAQMEVLNVVIEAYGTPLPDDDRQQIIGEFEKTRELILEGMGRRGTGGIQSDFVDSLIRHHQAALLMAEILLANSEHEEIRELANNVVQEQSREIEALQGWSEENEPAQMQR